jgi:aminoglycoside phosphotransferase (APT) family kinase protein
MSEAPSAAALSKLAPSLAPGGRGIGAVKALSGGASQELWSIAVATDAGENRVVLRRAPPGRARSDLAAPIELEAELIERAGRQGVPVAQVRYVLKPEDGLGAGFFMEHVEGEALGQRIVREDRFAPVRPMLARQCGEILARIHAIPAPAALPVSNVANIIDALERAHLAEARPRPVFALAFKWLRAHLPAQPRLCVVHGDFRNGNMLIGEHGVAAVLDWELVHAGDPMEDLGWICTNSWRFGVIDKPVGGFGAREDLYAGYEAAGGRVDRAAAKFWEVLGSLRWGVMCTFSTVALRDNPALGVERYVIARRASETELDLVNLLDEA